MDEPGIVAQNESVAPKWAGVNRATENGAIASKRVTYDFARLMDGATKNPCSEFGDNIIEHMS